MEGWCGPLVGVCTRLGLHHPTVALTITSFGSSLISTTFMFYYVKVFLNLYHIDPGWFQAAQVLFMIWNAINDPLFGYCQDVGRGWMRSRKRSMVVSAPFYAASFMLFWIPWGGQGSPPWVVGLHLIVALFFYDGFLSFALLAWSALFAEVSTDHAARVRAVKYNQVAVLLGVNVVTILEKTSSSLQNFFNFQIGCAIVAVIGFFCIRYTGKYAVGEVAQLQSFKHLVDPETEQEEAKTSWSEGWTTTRQVLRGSSFQRITATNFLHICRSTCHLNFATIFTEALIPRAILPLGSWYISLFYGSCAVLPQILLIAGSSLVEHWGPQRLMQTSFLVSVATGLFMYLFGSHIPYLVMLFMLVDSINVHSFSPMMNIVFADVIDDDMLRNQRRSPISSIIFSLNALFTKPAQSLAPMVVVYTLQQNSYEAYKLGRLLPESSDMAKLQNAMFALLTLTPVVLAALEWVLMRNYLLKDKHFEQKDENNKRDAVC